MPGDQGSGTQHSPASHCEPPAMAVTRNKKRKARALAEPVFVSSDSEDDFDAVEYLEEAPPNMRKITNKDDPIYLLDESDDEEDEGDRRKRLRRDTTGGAAGPSRAPVRQPRTLGSPPIDDDPPVAGPSRVSQPPAPSTSHHRHLPESRAAVPSTPSQAPRLTVDHPPAPTNLPAVPKAIDHLSQVLEILPDIAVDWIAARIEALKEGIASERLVEAIVLAALEMEEGYPKSTAPKAAPAAVVAGDYTIKTYRAELRMGPTYADQSRAALLDHFPNMPVNHVRWTFMQNGCLFAPTYFELSRQLSLDIKPYVELQRPRTVKKGVKGKAVAEAATFELGQSGTDLSGYQEWLLENAFLEAVIEKRTAADAAEMAKQAHHDAEMAAGNGIECGCCFGEDLMEDMFQCSEGHLFCRECSTRHAEIKLGDQCTTISCMDTSGCVALFPEMELSRLLSRKSLELYYRLKLTADLALAGIEGLETCPACDYAVIIDDPAEKLFVCQKEGCKQVSCRQCRRKEHLPKSCEEMEKDRKLDKRHAIEDAMSAALIRKCPTCAKPYLKDTGCNKIMCTGCRTVSCYICQKAIPEGYAHFDQMPGTASTTRIKFRCALWDAEDAQKDQEAVVRARDAARAEVERLAAAEGLQLAEEDLNVAAPERPPPARPPVPAAPAGHPVYAHAARPPANALYERVPPFPPFPPAVRPPGPLVGPNGAVALPPLPNNLRNRPVQDPAAGHFNNPMFQALRQYQDAGQGARQPGWNIDALLNRVPAGQPVRLPPVPAPAPPIPRGGPAPRAIRPLPRRA